MPLYNAPIDLLLFGSGSDGAATVDGLEGERRAPRRVIGDRERHAQVVEVIGHLEFVKLQHLGCHINDLAVVGRAASGAGQDGADTRDPDETARGGTGIGACELVVCSEAFQVLLPSVNG